MKFSEIQLQTETFMIVGGPWLARAGNLDIPIGILRFLSLPGPLGSILNRENHKIPFAIALLQSKTGFRASGPQKMAPERYLYKAFLAGTANVDFCSARCVFGGQEHKRVHFIESIGFYRIIGSCGLQPLDILKDVLKDFLKDFQHIGDP